LVKKFRARAIVVGEDFRFGKDASSGIQDLVRIARARSVKVDIVRHLKRGGKIISSTIIRKMVLKGRIDKASELLGRPFSILGTVVGGARLARKLGYPTANVNPHHEAMPPSGVYAVRIKFGSRLYNGVMNIGVKPTFYDHGRDREPSIEVHIFGFRQRIYGRDLEITFVRRLRAEKKFKTIDSLIRQIKRDESEALHYLLYKRK
jgi:riboflavin kinase/FMN adenylyltransferase